MGVKNVISKIADKAGNKVSQLSKLSSEQVAEIERQREEYLLEMPSPNDANAEKMTKKLMAASSVEIFNAYLKQLKELYLPVDYKDEFNDTFNPDYNIRYFNITKWVTNREENNLEKLVNVYAVLADEDCNIALVFNRTRTYTNVYLAVVNTGNVGNSTDVKNYKERLIEAIKGNFPGVGLTNLESDEGIGLIPCLDNDKKYSIATATNIPNEKSEKFISQTIEKLLDGSIPDSIKKEYTIVLLASPIKDIEERKLKLSELYSALVPYSEWTTNFTYSENKSSSSSATIGVNVGASAGAQNSNSQSSTNSNALSNNESYGITDSTTESKSETNSIGVNAGINKGVIKAGVNTSKGKTTSNSIGKSISKSLGNAVTKAAARTDSIAKSANLGANFGANFARSSTVTAMIGKNEAINQSFENFSIKHALKLLDNQMKRLDQSSALGMWDFAAYVLSEDSNVANNVAHSYLALTQGEESYNSQSAINLWKGNIPTEESITREIVNYVRELRHPIFALNSEILKEDEDYNVYPTIVTATTSLSGKELAYSLNFPKSSISGLPVIECAEFGRDIVTYDKIDESAEKIKIGKIFHMNNIENIDVNLYCESLTSHTFVTGSTGSGKSNTIYKIIESCKKLNKKFLIIEPAKGEYKNVFGNEDDTYVYGTNPKISPLLRINPFSFSKEIHVLEHMDRLVELFNVCWPMYAAMPSVLKEAVENSYKECGWDLTTSENKYKEDLYPTFADVARNIKYIIDSSEFDSDNKGAYKGALLVRLKSLTNGINGMIFNNNELSTEDLFNKNVIIDLSRVGSLETKSLIMGMLIMKLQEYRMSESNMNSSLKHITVLEEAHNILKRTSIEQSTETSNLVGKSVEMLTNAIAEMRTYGEGFVIVDQSPGLLDMSVIRNTNTKIIMRLPDQSDRELVGKAANLNDEQIKELAKLPCGVAAIYQNEWVQPILSKIDKYSIKEIYQHTKKEELSKLYKDEIEVESSLLDSIMNEEILRKDGKISIKLLKNRIIKSQISTKVKIALLDYLNSKDKDTFDNLRILLYEFLSADKAIELSRNIDNINDWVNNVIKELSPSIANYPKNQIIIALSLIIYEKAMRDSSYNDLMCKFVEMYQIKGDAGEWVK